MPTPEQLAEHRLLQNPQRLFDWLGPVPDDEIVPVFTFSGPSLTCALGAKITMHSIQDLADSVAGAGERLIHRTPVIQCGQLGKRRFMGHIPIQLPNSYEKAHQSTTHVSHVILPRFDNFNRPIKRVWLRDVSANSERAPSLVPSWQPRLAILVVTPAMFAGKCELGIDHGLDALELARGQVGNDVTQTPEPIRAGISEYFHPTCIGRGQHGIFIARLNAHQPLLSVKWKARGERQHLAIQPDLTVSPVSET